MIPIPNLSSVDQLTQAATSGGRVGNSRGGGADFNFGGINDSPARKWIWITLAGTALVAALLFYFTTRNST